MGMEGDGGADLDERKVRGINVCGLEVYMSRCYCI